MEEGNQSTVVMFRGYPVRWPVLPATQISSPFTFASKAAKILEDLQQATIPDLVSLPTEILLHIFDDLYAHTPKKFWPDVPLDPGAVTESDCDYRAAYDTLAALARTCRNRSPLQTMYIALPWSRSSLHTRS
jgi:hypothetical protein